MLPDAALFVVEKIANQAAKENIPLSEVERNMLLFSETCPTLSNIAEVNEVFERDYDCNDFEEKIGRLIRHVREDLSQDPDANRAWKHAVRKLSTQDYYLLVMLKENGFNERPPGDLIRLIGTALLIVSLFVSIVFLFIR